MVAAQRPSSRRPDESGTARDAMLRRYLPLVRSAAYALSRWKPPHIDFDDLLNWGIHGLLDAYQRYDPDRRASFGTYARFRVRGTILDNLRAQDRMSRSSRQKAVLLERTHDRLEATLKRAPTEEEVARAIGVDLTAVRAMAAEARAGCEVALGELCACKEEHDVNEHLADNESDPQLAVLAGERSSLIVAALVGLTAKERVVVTLYYAKDLTMREVAHVLGVTESRVSQLHSRALTRLRLYLGPRLAPDS